jgi:hypothetical protein
MMKMAGMLECTRDLSEHLRESLFTFIVKHVHISMILLYIISFHYLNSTYFHFQKFLCISVFVCYLSLFLS